MKGQLLWTLSWLCISSWSPTSLYNLSIFHNPPLHHYFCFSVRFGNMSIHIEVPSDFGQGQLNAIELRSKNDLAPQSRVFLKHGCHVQHVILPENPHMSTVIYNSHTFICNDINEEDIFRPTAQEVLVACQNVGHSHRRGMLSRPVKPHRLLNKN